MNTAQGIWTIRERNPDTKELVSEKIVHNVITNFGLTALAGSSFGGYSTPIYLVIEDFTDTLPVQVNAGDVQVQTNIRLDTPNDTQLVLSVGLPNQEIVTYSTITGTGPYFYQLTAPTAQIHAIGEHVCRNVSAFDDITTVQNEQQVDSVNLPTQRATSPGGYSAGVGNWTMQFYISGVATAQNFVICGLADSLNLGTGNLHNHFVLGYYRLGSTNDIEIDGSITIANA